VTDIEALVLIFVPFIWPLVPVESMESLFILLFNMLVCLLLVVPSAGLLGKVLKPKDAVSPSCAARL
jgi:hypothetical protein